MKKTLFTLSLLTLITTACVPVLLVGAGAGASATLARDSRSLQTINDDTSIQFQANQKLQADQPLYLQSHLTVTSFKNVVLLTGETASDALRAKAESLVQSVPKVRRVYNMIQVAPEIGPLQVSNDATIYANIRTRMLVTSNVNASDFKWVVENKIVYLMGYASHEETRVALDVISNSAGVTRVINLVQYSDDKNVPPQMQSPAVNAMQQSAVPNSGSVSTTLAPVTTASAPVSPPQAAPAAAPSSTFVAPTPIASSTGN